MTRRLSVKTLVLMALAAGIWPAHAQRPYTNQPPAWIARPLALADAVNLALQQNGAIRRGKSDLEAQYGLVMQTRAIAIPKLQATGGYQYSTEVETFPFPNFQAPVNTWNANLQLVQTIYQGGQINAALRSARLTKDQALLQYQTVVADSLLAVKIGYYDVLQTAEQVGVEEASVELLTKEAADQKRRFDAGTVPRFDVLRANVELANERPRLIHARNAYRVAKDNFLNQLGFRPPPRAAEDIPLQLTDKLDADPYEIELPAAVALALADRSELAALRKQESLRAEGVITAKSGYKPVVQFLGGYGGRSSEFFSDPGYVIHGPSAGAQVSWSIFDGFLTKGKIEQATALHDGSRVDVENEERTIELEVRTDYSNFTEARETLESQKKVVEEAEEALRLAKARNEAGTGTQLDVLSAQTALTQARSTQVQALHDYDVTRARLERAMGINIMQTMGR